LTEPCPYLLEYYSFFIVISCKLPRHSLTCGCVPSTSVISFGRGRPHARKGPPLSFPCIILGSLSLFNHSWERKGDKISCYRDVFSLVFMEFMVVIIVMKRVSHVLFVGKSLLLKMWKKIGWLKRYTKPIIFTVLEAIP